MCLNNKQSLEVTFNHLSNRFPTLAIWLAEEPSLILPILNEVAFDLVGEVYPDYHKIHKEVYLLHDLVDSARPGDEVEITGIYINKFDYFSNVKHGFPVFTTIIEANYVRRFGDEEIIEIMDEDKQAIRELSKKPNIAKRI